MAIPSHRLKLYRADQHIEQIELIAEPMRDRREYPVVESVQSQRKGLRCDYRLDLSSEQPPEMLPILIGDYMFNVRSALDHLAVALAPRKYRHKISFPILTTDPLAQDDSGDYLNAEAASRWLALKEWLPDDRFAALKALQPYEASALQGQAAENHALALLSAFQNADKHRELINTVAGLAKAELHIDGDVTYVVPVFQHRTIVARSNRKMDVQVKGVPLLGLARGDAIWSFDLLIKKLTAFVADEALPRLEPFLK